MSNIMDRMTRELHEAASRREKPEALVLTAFDFKEWLSCAQSLQMLHDPKRGFSFMGVPILIGRSFQLVYTPDSATYSLWNANKDDGQMRRVK